MTPQQAAMTIASLKASYFTTGADGVEWWKLPSGEWLGKRVLSATLVDLRRFPAGSCNCGG